MSGATAGERAEIMPVGMYRRKKYEEIVRDPWIRRISAETRIERAVGRNSRVEIWMGICLADKKSVRYGHCKSPPTRGPLTPVQTERSREPGAERTGISVYPELAEEDPRRRDAKQESDVRYAEVRASQDGAGVGHRREKRSESSRLDTEPETGEPNILRERDVKK
ncbi:hypothetical protein B0H19DRAFT_1080083 [Mycena capillaripes]|nr:hypothetical protein B0H19DRAFT_1080083 [Mycena capillaripes]